MSNEKWIWWKHGVIYQIYIRSFYDSNNDGIGDLTGVIEKLDYLKFLGIDAIWISPFHESPNVDFGYDVDDYLSINPEYGDLNIFIELLSKAHKIGIRVVMDLVMNHTSSNHVWFKKSRQPEKNSKDDWYIWKESKKGVLPNNWKSAYGGSAWQWDSAKQKYYLHSFLKEQPDLNWRSKSLEKKFFKQIKYWLDLGVDGFRLDVINCIGKDKKYRNNPGLFQFFGLKNQTYNRNQKKSLKVIKKLRKLVDQYEDRMLVGEVFTLPPGNSRNAARFLGNGNNLLHMTFDFSLIFQKWGAKSYYKTISEWYTQIPKNGWPSNVLSNHDLFRSINRIGMRSNNEQKAKVMATLLLTLKGTPFVYYGEEIGMENLKIKRTQIKDHLGKKYWPIFSGRDRARTPMQWTEEKNAGFTTSEPWLPVNDNYDHKNVANLSASPNSIFNLYRELIKLRKKNPAFQKGVWSVLSKGENGVLSYYRAHKKDKFLVLLNFTSHRRSVEDKHNVLLKIVVSTHKKVKEVLKPHRMILEPYEATIVRIL